MQRIDIVLFGATGFTGKFVAKELAKAYKCENFTWAVAGRSKSKLSELLSEIKNEIGKFESNLNQYLISFFVIMSY